MKKKVVELVRLEGELQLLLVETWKGQAWRKEQAKGEGEGAESRV